MLKKSASDPSMQKSWPAGGYVPLAGGPPLATLPPRRLQTGAPFAVQDQQRAGSPADDCAIIHVRPQQPPPTLPLHSAPARLTKPPLDEATQRKVDRTVCAGLCVARLTCSWFLKVCFLITCVQYVFVFGALSHAIWIPISLNYACQASSDALKPQPFDISSPMRSLTDCKGLCESRSSCQAIDYYNETGWCNLYTQPCEQPTADWDGANSWQIVSTCALHNGSTGVLIRGKCNTNVQLPTTWSVVCGQTFDMLRSPRSWALTFAVAVPFICVHSPWVRQALPSEKLANTYRRLSACGYMRLVLVLVCAVAWITFTFSTFGVPEFTTGEGKVRGSGPGWLEKVWFAASALATLMISCRPVRMILAPVLSILSCVASALSSLFVGMVGCVVGAVGNLMEMLGLSAVGMSGAAGALGGIGGGAAAAGDAAAAMEAGAAGSALAGADSAAAVGGGVLAGDTAVGVHAAVAADGVAGGAAAAEGAMAADAALAAEAAAIAETAAEGAAIVAFCVLQ